MKTFLTSIVVSLLVAAGVSFFVLSHDTKQNFGATGNAGANALFEQSLAQPLGTTDANMYLTSGADVQSNLLPLNSYQCLSIDTGQPNFEAVCGTVTTTSTSSLTLLISLRGLSTQTATTSNTGFIFTHRRGADVRITDFPTLTVNNNELNGVQAIPNSVFYSSNFTPTFWTNAASNTLATIGIVNSTVAAGCGNANESASGCAQLATGAQASAGTSIGSTGARLVIPGSLATSTPGTNATNQIPVTVAGKLAQGFLDLTQAFTVTGAWVFNTAAATFNAGFLSTASSTLTATTSIAASNVNSDALIIRGIPYAYPSVQGVASSFLKNDGSGNLSWATASHYNYATTTATSKGGGGNGTITSQALTIPAGVMTGSSTITISGSGSCTGDSADSCTVQARLNSTTEAVCSITPGNSLGFVLTFTIKIFNNNSTGSQISTCQLTAIQGGGSFTSYAATGSTATSVNTALAFTTDLQMTGTNAMTISNVTFEALP